MSALGTGAPRGLASAQPLQFCKSGLSTGKAHPWPPTLPCVLRRILGWTKANEINNGRWVMMGLLVGLLTEYATGVSFIGQLKLMLSYSGLWDFDS